MRKRALGRTDVRVSALGLGTMTWGQQNSEAEGHAQLDLAIERGVNFIDTAEMYPVPPRAETVNRTEAYLGRWLSRRSDRDRLVIATKVAGRSKMKWLRGGARLSRDQVTEALNASLRRLQTDYVDLYQVHWPERSTNYFGRLGYRHREGDEAIPVEETLRALSDLVVAGKVRAIGLSNETPWGVHEYLRLAEQHGLARVVTVQNPYSLLNRVFEVGLAEFAHREQVGLLAYSPLGFGVLSGKYSGGERPEGARLTLFGDHFTRYVKPRALAATERYVALAREAGLDPAQMALAFVTSRPFVTSTLVGATTLEQLRSNLDSAEVTLSDDLLQAIEAVHDELPNPAP